jgi:hypothetical protein
VGVKRGLRDSSWYDAVEPALLVMIPIVGMATKSYAGWRLALAGLIDTGMLQSIG